MDSLAMIDWGIAAHADYRREELMRTADHERLIRQCRRMQRLARLIAKMQVLKEQAEASQAKTADQAC